MQNQTNESIFIHAFAGAFVGFIITAVVGGIGWLLGFWGGVHDIVGLISIFIFTAIGILAKYSAHLLKIIKFTFKIARIILTPMSDYPTLGLIAFLISGVTVIQSCHHRESVIYKSDLAALKEISTTVDAEVFFGKLQTFISTTGLRAISSFTATPTKLIISKQQSGRYVIVYHSSARIETNVDLGALDNKLTIEIYSALIDLCKNKLKDIESISVLLTNNDDSISTSYETIIVFDEAFLSNPEAFGRHITHIKDTSSGKVFIRIKK